MVSTAVHAPLVQHAVAGPLVHGPALVHAPALVHGPALVGAPLVHHAPAVIGTAVHHAVAAPKKIKK